MTRKAHAPNPRRAELVALSANFKGLVKAGMFPNINAALRAHYSAEVGREDWDTFKGWKGKGFSVRKGARGFPVWATPRERNGTTPAPEDAPPDVMSGAEGPQWFPVAYLFHGGQVDRQP